MPPPKKIDLIPPELRRKLAEALLSRGFADIEAVTEELNFWLEEDGQEIRLGKSSVGAFSKLLKSQRNAMAIAETLIADMDLDGESNMHRALMQMIGAAMFQLFQTVSESETPLDAKQLANLARTLKDLMHSAGLREKMLEDERERIKKQAREEAEAEMARKMDDAVTAGDVEKEAAQRAMEIMGFA